MSQQIANGYLRILAIVLATMPLFGPAAAPAGSQQPPQLSQEASSDPVLRVTSRLVQVNVIVNDKHGNPIHGLRQNDFSILDNGKPQRISLFSAETNAPPNLPRIELPSGTFTNRPEELSSLPASVTVILFDALNTEGADQVLARKQVLRALRDIQPQEYVALYGWAIVSLFCMTLLPTLRRFARFLQATIPRPDLSSAIRHRATLV